MYQQNGGQLQKIKSPREDLRREAVITNLCVIFHLCQQWCADILTPKKALNTHSGDKKRRDADSLIFKNLKTEDALEQQESPGSFVVYV